MYIYTHAVVRTADYDVPAYYCSARHSYTYLCTDASFPFSSHAIYYIFIILVCTNTVTNHTQNVYNNKIYDHYIIHGYPTKSYIDGSSDLKIKRNTYFVFYYYKLFRRGMVYVCRPWIYATEYICTVRHSISASRI